MKLINMKCKKCGADLSIDLDHLQAYCQYCGSKLSIDIDKLGELLAEKEKTKQSKNWLLGEKEKTKRMKSFNNRNRDQDNLRYKLEKQKIENDYKRQKEKDDISSTFKMFFLLILGMLVFILLAELSKRNII